MSSRRRWPKWVRIRSPLSQKKQCSGGDVFHSTENKPSHLSHTQLIKQAVDSWCFRSVTQFLSVRPRLSVFRAQPLWDFRAAPEGDGCPPRQHSGAKRGRRGGVRHHGRDLRALRLHLLGQLPLPLRPRWWCLPGPALHGHCHKPRPQQRRHAQWWSPEQQHHERPACDGQCQGKRHKQQVTVSGRQQNAAMQRPRWWQRTAAECKWTGGHRAEDATRQRNLLQTARLCTQFEILIVNSLTFWCVSCWGFDAQTEIN